MLSLRPLFDDHGDDDDATFSLPQEVQSLSLRTTASTFFRPVAVRVKGRSVTQHHDILSQVQERVSLASRMFHSSLSCI